MHTVAAHARQTRNARAAGVQMQCQVGGNGSSGHAPSSPLLFLLRRCSLLFPAAPAAHASPTLLAMV